MKRRSFLQTAAALSAAPMLACSRKTAPPLPPGTLSGNDFALGHRLRNPDFPEPGETRRTPVLIIGAGIAGLSAAWRLARAGVRDFMIVDLEATAGGNARYGESAICRYPFGAHYLPLPTMESAAVRHLLADFGGLQGDPRLERPSYDERLLCHTPQERVYHKGIWQEGPIPRLGASADDRQQWLRFHARMAEFKEARDFLGRRAFALPVAAASRDARWLGFDSVTMAEWLAAENFDSVTLHWYVNYACRDDFGTDYRQTSAWAGIHYFACRNGQAANAGGDAVLTAPEGNGWIVRRLTEKLADRLLTGAACFRLEQQTKTVTADLFLKVEGRSIRIVAEQVVWAAALFVLPRVAVSLPAPLAALAGAGEYAPWLVANLSLSELPAAGVGAPLSWDNVLYDAPGLGYVVATHQQVRIAPGPSVFTYYRVLSELPPAKARELLMNSSREAWATTILEELGRAHPDLPALTTRLDVFRHGHAMIRPLPGVVHSSARQALVNGWQRVQFAHADLSGMSLFEEANYHGVRAAEVILSRLGVGESSLLA